MITINYVIYYVNCTESCTFGENYYIIDYVIFYVNRTESCTFGVNYDLVKITVVNIIILFTSTEYFLKISYFSRPTNPKFQEFKMNKYHYALFYIISTVSTENCDSRLLFMTFIFPVVLQYHNSGNIMTSLEYRDQP